MPTATLHEVPPTVQELASPQGERALSSDPQTRVRVLFDESILRAIVAEVGVRWRGMWNPLPGKLEPLVLLDNHFGSTLGIPVSQLTVEFARAHVAASDLQFSKVAR